MNWIRLTQKTGFILFLSLAACVSNGENDFRVASLEEHLPALEQSAMNWRPDAFLDFAHLSVRSGEFEPSPLRAHFLSLSNLNQSLLVTLASDGSITTEVVNHDDPLIPGAPITNTDWSIDGSEALDIALDDKAMKFLEENLDNQCSFMVLERDTDSLVQSVNWRVTLSSCLDPSVSLTIIIDASDGSVLRRE